MRTDASQGSRRLWPHCYRRGEQASWRCGRTRGRAGVATRVMMMPGGAAERCIKVKHGDEVLEPHRFGEVVREGAFPAAPARHPQVS